MAVILIFECTEGASVGREATPAPLLVLKLTQDGAARNAKRSIWTILPKNRGL